MLGQLERGWGRVRCGLASQAGLPARLELTQAVLKPDMVLHPPNLAAAQEMILASGFLVVRSRLTCLTRSAAEQFYAEHRGKFFYNRLVTFMSSGPCQPLILAKQNAILDWRELMGPTKVFRTGFTHPDSIRGKFGLTDTRNCSHGSDAAATAEREIQFFFPDFDLVMWEAEERAQLEAGNVRLDRSDFIHRIVTTM